jgi:Type II secretion system (T2SS), protein E, N-terminal domain
MKLGEILVKRGLVTEVQLEAATVEQHTQGLRLGTYFVEKGILTSDQVALALAEQFGVPPALEADFVRAETGLRKRLVVNQAIELMAIPLFHVNPRRVAVAMGNPANPQALDRLAFILGATVDPMVTSEVALERQFELLYGVRRKGKSTFVKPVALSLPAPHQAVVRKAPREESEIRPALRTHSAPKRPVKAINLAPLKPGSETREPAAPIEIMEDSLCFTPTPLTYLPPANTRNPPTPTRVAARNPLTPIVVPITSSGAQLAVDQIRFATDQQDLADSLFTFMRACFTVGAMFSVAAAEARGRFGFSDGQVRPEIENMTFPLTLPSCLRIARSRRGTYRGAPPPDGMAVQKQLWQALRCETPADVLVSPVIVDGQVTLLLYAQAEGDARINSIAAGRMEQVCQAMSSSLLRLAV